MGQVLAVHLPVVPAALLGVVHGGVGVLEQGGRVGAVFGVHGDADAGADAHLGVLCPEGPGEALRTRWAIWMAARASSRDGRAITNSSPPRRARCRAGSVRRRRAGRDDVADPQFFLQAQGHLFAAPRRRCRGRGCR